VGRAVRLAPALDVLREVEMVAPHVEWMVHDAPRAIVAGDELAPPFEPT
jgi:hypothetical protein